MILFFGDVHGHFKHVRSIVEKERPAAIILLGDIEPSRPLEKELEAVLLMTELWFIHGNHDTDDDRNHDFLFNSALKHKNLHGRVELIDGHRVAGLGGIFRGAIWYPHNGRVCEPSHESYAEFSAHLDRQMAYHQLNQDKMDHLLRTHKSSIFLEDWVNLECSKADILVSHEAPSCHHYGFDVIDDLVRKMGVQKLFHGHHHDRKNYSEHFVRMGFQTYGVGFCGVSDLHGNVIQKGDFDDNPQHWG